MPLCVENLTINDEEIDRSSKHEHCNGVISDTLNFAVSPNDQAPCYSNNCATDLHVSEKQNGNADVFVAPPSEKQSSSSYSAKTGFYLLPGETLDCENGFDMGNRRVFLTQYRIVIVDRNLTEACVLPLTNLDILEAKDATALNFTCKDGRVIRLRADNSETALLWYKKLLPNTCVTRVVDAIFAFAFCSYVSKNPASLPKWLRPDLSRDIVQPNSSIDVAYETILREFKQLRLSDTAWKITTVNKRFEFCPTYPQYLIVPTSVTDDELKVMRYGRFHYRIPTLVWRCRTNGAVLLRSSQPNFGFLGMMTNENDVKLYEKIRNVATTNEQTSKFLIVDARSYTAAWTNRAKSGGFESSDYYPNAEVIFMNLPNIHVIRYSFLQLRNLMNLCHDSPNYLNVLQSTNWLQNMGQLFITVERCLKAICKDGVSVLVHCSDGWDRTTQIISLCMLIADPHYRTFEGFRTLVQRQWIEFGHKFADRNGVLNGDENEKSPVFLQWLDCVYQLWVKNENCFQFNQRYLLKLLQHSYSGLFGSFLFNSIKEAADAGCVNLPPEAPLEGLSAYSEKPTFSRTFSIWSYLGSHNQEFLNPAFDIRQQKRYLNYPKHLADLKLWDDAYSYAPGFSLFGNSEDFNSSTGSHDVSSEKPTLSRSQSASSLTSLEQNVPSMHSFHGSGYFNPTAGAGVHSIQNSTNNSYQKNNDASNGVSHDSPNHYQKALNVDGLSRLPVKYEDRIIEKYRDIIYADPHWNKTSSMTMVHGPHRETNGLHPLKFPTLDGSVPYHFIGVVSPQKPCFQKGGRTRNESVDSTGFEILGECNTRQKHNSAASTNTSASSLLPSSCSSTCTTLSEYSPSSSMATSTSTAVNGTATHTMA